jgi:tripartite ATP-independent transporter DctP family solute receptor
LKDRIMIARRHLLGAAAASALATPAFAQTRTAIRVSTAAPPSDFLAKALEQLKTEVEAANVGLGVETYPAGTLFRQGTEVAAMQRGTLEMSTMTTFEVAQQLPEYGFLNRGYLFRDYAHLQAVFNGPIGAEYRAVVSDKMGIEILATAYLGTRHVNLRRKRAVTAPADLAGIKMRMPGGPEWLLLGRAIGVSPVPLGAPEVYLALKTGTIDGQENPLSILNATKLYEVTEQVVLTAHLLQPVFINIATPAWKKLSPEQQKALQAAAVSAAKANDDGRLEDERTIIDGLKARGLSVDNTDLAAFRANADRVYGEAESSKAWNADWMKRVQDTK